MGREQREKGRIPADGGIVDIEGAAAVIHEVDDHRRIAGGDVDCTGDRRQHDDADG